MTTIYAAQIARTQRAIAKKGLIVTWVKHSVTTDSNHPWKTSTGTPLTYQVSIVLTLPRGLANQIAMLLKGTEVPAGMASALMGAVPFTPEVADSLIVVMAGIQQTYVIKAIDIVRPDGTPILYKLQLE
jgi:hypothetical protein